MSGLKSLVTNQERPYLYLMSTSLHAHVSRSATDCDGRLDDTYVVTLNDEEIAEHERAQGVNDFHDLNFKERVLGSFVSFHNPTEVKTSETGFSSTEQHDEGYIWVEVEWCEDESCDPRAKTHRDLYAEMMGY